MLHHVQCARTHIYDVLINHWRSLFTSILFKLPLRGSRIFTCIYAHMYVCLEVLHGIRIVAVSAQTPNRTLLSVCSTKPR